MSRINLATVVCRVGSQIHKPELIFPVELHICHSCHSGESCLGMKPIEFICIECSVLDFACSFGFRLLSFGLPPGICLWLNNLWLVPAFLVFPLTLCRLSFPACLLLFIRRPPHNTVVLAPYEWTSSPRTNINTHYAVFLLLAWIDYFWVHCSTDEIFLHFRSRKYWRGLDQRFWSLLLYLFLRPTERSDELKLPSVSRNNWDCFNDQKRRFSGVRFGGKWLFNGTKAVFMQRTPSIWCPFILSEKQGMMNVPP